MAAAGVTAGVVGFWPRATLPEPWQNPLANAKFTRLTDFPGTETHGQSRRTEGSSRSLLIAMGSSISG